ncbi:hypothetical protein [Arcobacter ellisii]|uniref:Uncharacterized protein n=1 Tax=Arcobacter ellisii TaxID=913109 RepID=A0A347U9F9_9BACT|nr:hypothetical protein [Arcobacter ellisii]AXX95487.1 hypothetical protein AELL_1834 [Arcobacter ellisii]RXI29866.1 hypothetical protein CP962_09375 [Arcobacter ellisii]
MSFFEEIKNSLSLLKESNYDFGGVYSQNPNNINIFILISIVLLLSIIILLINAFKKSQLSKDISTIKDSSDFLEFDKKLTKISKEISKRGIEIANKLNLSKNEICEKGLYLIKDFNIKEKIDAYKKISNNFDLISKNTKRYEIGELNNFFEEKSISLLEKNLLKEIESYYKNTRFCENDVEFVNSIVSYSKNLPNPFSILNPLQEEINKFSLAFNLDVYKFVKKLTKNFSGEIFVKSNKKLEDLFKNEEAIISEVILKHILENENKQKVYDYISNLKNKSYLQNLYYKFFEQSEDLDLSLSFIKNKTEIENDYKEYLNSQITYHWKDLEYVKYILNAPRVLQIIGHDDYRTILERMEKLQKEIDFEKSVSEILNVAKNAEKIAKEAKAIARSR